MDIKDFSALLKAKREGTGHAHATRAARQGGTHGQRPLPGQLPQGRLCQWRPAALAGDKTPAVRLQVCGGRLSARCSRRNHLFSSVKYTPGDYRVRVANDVEYAPPHNWGRRDASDRDTPDAEVRVGDVLQGGRHTKKAAKSKRKGKTRQRNCRRKPVCGKGSPLPGRKS